jgi:cytochrome bd-type quinol oxidase subunit 2
MVLAAAWPAARKRLGLLPPALALLAVIMVPITTSAGSWLAQRVGRTPLVDRHEALGNTMLPWAIAMLVVTVAVWAWHRTPRKTVGRTRSIPTIVLAVAALVVAAGAVWTIVQIGESGATAVWSGNFSNEPLPAP